MVHVHVYMQRDYCRNRFSSQAARNEADSALTSCFDTRTVASCCPSRQQRLMIDASEEHRLTDQSFDIIDPTHGWEDALIPCLSLVAQDREHSLATAHAAPPNAVLHTPRIPLFLKITLFRGIVSRSCQRRWPRQNHHSSQSRLGLQH